MITGCRQRIADRYNSELGGLVRVPRLPDDRTSVWAQYTIAVPPERRDDIVAGLKARGIPTAIHYAVPVHRQTAYRSYPVAGNGLPVSERLADEVLSLPMHPYLAEPEQDRIVAAIKAELN